MEPVVNGLEDIYGSEIDVRRLNANLPDGKTAFQYYSLQGHPSFVLLNPEGEVLWQGLGEQSSENLHGNIDIALGK